MHELKWAHRASFAFRAGCTCGWEEASHHLLEREAEDQFRAHQLRAGAQPPHCRHHPEFRSDCADCVREREQA